LGGLLLFEQSADVRRWSFFMTINKDLLDILVCPACRKDVELKDNFIVCTACRRQYPIREGIPIMLINEALTPDGAPKPQEKKDVG